MANNLRGLWNRGRDTEYRPSNDSNQHPVTRSQSGSIHQQLREAQRRIRELQLAKQAAENSAARLRNMVRSRSDDVAKKEMRIVQVEATERRLRSDYNRLQGERDAWQKKSQGIRADYNFILDNLVKPYAIKRNLEFQGLTDESITKVISPMLRHASQHGSLFKEVQRLRGQVQELQHDMLAKVEKVEAITDDQFAKEFRSLASAIKSFSRSIRFTTQANIIEVLGSLVLLKDVAPHHWSSRARKKPLIEAWIWSILICLVFENPYVIFGDHCKALDQAWLQVYGTEHLDGWPRPSSHCETWRVKTVEQLLEQISPETITHGESGLLAEGLTASVIDHRKLIANAICGHFDSLSPGYKVSDVQLIINKALSLAMRMSLQQSRFQVTYPAIGADFQSEEMLPLDDDDDEDMEPGVVAFIINPGLTKWGDVHGEQYDQCYSIVPALVQLEPKIRGLNTEDDRQSDFDMQPEIKQEPDVKQEPVVKQEPEWC